jgi:hypothetical protein
MVVTIQNQYWNQERKSSLQTGWTYLKHSCQIWCEEVSIPYAVKDDVIQIYSGFIVGYKKNKIFRWLDAKLTRTVGCMATTATLQSPYAQLWDAISKRQKRRIFLWQKSRYLSDHRITELFQGTIFWLIFQFLSISESCCPLRRCNCV